MPEFEEQVEKHESYGMIGFSRCQSSRATNLFGSAVKHHNLITLVIRRADKRRDLNRTWYFGQEELISVVMSPTQFVDAISNFNMGDGVPCTIEYVNRKMMAPCPETSEKEVFQKEFREDLEGMTSEIRSLISEATETLRSRLLTRRIGRRC